MRKANPDCYDMPKWYGMIYYQFKPRCAPFWILVLLFRKFWIAFAFIIFRGNPSLQPAVVLLVLFTRTVFQVMWRPFLSPRIIRELDSMDGRSVKEPLFAEFREI
jgi:cellulose synthase/poly-beta-1,6-N-acetylglucosamine synthase-like glycosyltransferase